MTSADAPIRRVSKLRLRATQLQPSYERPTTEGWYQSFFILPLVTTPHHSFAQKLIHTVLTLNIPITLSHSVPSLGLQPSSFDNALANLSTRSRTSRAGYPNPVKPHVKGGLAWWRGWQPYCSFSINSLIGMESGGSNGSSGTHGAVLKTIVAVRGSAGFARRYFFNIPKFLCTDSETNIADLGRHGCKG